MGADQQLLDVEIARLYALALVAIARADDQILPEQGVRLQERIAARAGQALDLEDLLLAEPLDPAELARQLRSAGTSPFRGSGVHPGTLAAMIAVDAIAVVLAKGYVSEAEGRQIIRFAMALGCSTDEVRAMSDHLAPWIAGR